MQLRNFFSMGVISLTLMLALTSAAFADSQSQPSGQTGGHGSMDMPITVKTETSMPGTNTEIDSGISSSGSNNQHEAMPGMDPNMPGMENAENQVEEHGATSDGHGAASDGHDESSIESEGVNWPVVGGFLGINLIVIAVAGILKLTQ
ncbi:hypothetical protein JCM15765_06860 [Paradesulfitobacterium aromaticivorans]